MFPHLPAALVHRLLLPLVKLLLPTSDNDLAAAQATAQALIEDFNPRTGLELRLAVRISLFSLESGSALVQASEPGRSANQIIQCRRSALALIKEADKAERRLEQLRASGAQPEEPAPAEEEAIEALVTEFEQRVSETRPAGPKPYKLRKIEQRLAKRRERDARMATPSFMTPPSHSAEAARPAL